MAEIVRTGPGSLYKGLIDYFWAQLDATNGKIDTRATPSDIVSEVTRTNAGSLYALLQSVINSARDAVISNTDGEIVAGFTNLQQGWNLDTLRGNLDGAIVGARDNINTHISSVVAAKSHVTAIRHYRVNATTDLGGNVYVPVTAPANTLKADIRINPVDMSAGTTNTWHPSWSNGNTVRLNAHYSEGSVACRLSFTVIEYV